CEVRRQRRQPAQVDAGLAWAMEVRTTGSQKTVAPRDIRIDAILIGRMAARHDFYSLTAKFTKLLKQGVELHGAVVIAARVGNYRPAPGCAYPADSLLQGRPLHRNIS